MGLFINRSMDFIKRNGALVFCVVFLLIFSKILIGDYNARIASSHGDNGAVFYSRLFKDCSHFQGDLVAQTGIYWLRGTIAFWLPALCWKYFSLNPEFLDLTFYYLQIVLMGLGVFIFTYNTSSSFLCSFTSMVTALYVWPWEWNLAAYPAIMHTAFYSVLAMSLANLTVASFTRKDSKLTTSLLFVSTALVHPVIAFYILVCFFCLVMMDKALLRFYLTPFRIILLFFLILLCFIPVLTKLDFKEELLTHTEHWEAVSKHMHSVPWGNYPPVFRTLSLKLLGFFMVTLCFVRNFKSLKKFELNVLLSVLFGAVILSLIQMIGIFLKQPTLAMTMGLRAFSLVSLVFWSYLVVFWWEKIEEVSKSFFKDLTWIDTFLFFVFGMVWIKMRGGIPLIPILALVFITFTRKIKYKWIGLILVFSQLFFTFFFKKEGLFWIAGDSIGCKDYVIILFLSFLFTGFLILKINKILVTLMIGFLALVLATRFAFKLGSESYRAPISSLYEAQLWAKYNTLPDAKFLTVENWRTISQRTAVTLMPLLTQEVYTPFRKLREFNDFLFRLYGIEKNWKTYGVLEINQLCMKGYYQLKEKDFLFLSDYFQAEYLVRRILDSKLNFHEVYQNDAFRIYHLK